MAITNYSFSSDFQDELLATMVRNPELFMGLNGVIDYGYFTGTSSQLVCKLMLEFYKVQNTFPTFPQLGVMSQDHARKSGNAEIATELVSYIQKLSEIGIRAAKFNRDEIVRFAVTRACTNAAMNVAKTIQEGKELTLDIPKMFQDALSVGNNILDQGYLAHADADFVLDTLLAKDYGIYTGYPILDDQVWRRGWGPGWLVVPVAPPKRFKTAFCLNLALNMVSPTLAYDVLYYACEISSELALLRAYQRIAGRTQDDFWENPKSFRKALHQGINMKISGNLHVKHFPSKTATIADIRAHALQVIQSERYKPKAIFIDYAETVKYSGDKDVPEHRQQSSIYTEARALGDELGCVIIMPDRCNRETVDQAVPTITSFQGAFEKAGIVDVAIGLCSTPEEALDHRLRYFIFANRHGEEGVHIRGKVDPERMVLTMDERLKHDEIERIDQRMAAVREQRRENRKPGKGKKDKAANDPRMELDEYNQGSPRASKSKLAGFKV